jgi:hypothetical protein
VSAERACKQFPVLGSQQSPKRPVIQRRAPFARRRIPTCPMRPGAQVLVILGEKWACGVKPHSISPSVLMSRNLKTLHLESPFLVWLFHHTRCRYIGTCL